MCKASPKIAKYYYLLCLLQVFFLHKYDFPHLNLSAPIYVGIYTWTQTLFFTYNVTFLTLI